MSAPPDTRQGHPGAPQTATAADYAEHYNIPSDTTERYTQLALGIRDSMGRRARSFSPMVKAGLIPFLANVRNGAGEPLLRFCDIVLAVHTVQLCGGRPPDGFPYPCIDDPAEALADDLNSSPSAVRNSLTRLYRAELFSSEPGRVLWRKPRRVFLAMPKRGRFRVVYPTVVLAHYAEVLAADESSIGDDSVLNRLHLPQGGPQDVTGVSVDRGSRTDRGGESVDASKGSRERPATEDEYASGGVALPGHFPSKRRGNTAARCTRWPTPRATAPG